eukprot:jgi/Picsp_1/3574/NSC_06411-R1_protein
MTGDFTSARLTQPIVVDYHNLLDRSKVPDALVMLEQALGKDGLGVIAVSNVPKYAELRKALLPLASTLAQFPKQTQEKWEDAASSYNVGWSLGKESLADGSTDTKKGSFYANPLHDRPTDDKILLEEYPSYARPNIWPSENLPELEPAFKALGRVMYDVGMLLLSKCQELVDSQCIETVEGSSRYKPLLVCDTASESKCVKGRLLCYLPDPCREKNDELWCGWHRDHGSLTALTPAYFLRYAETGMLKEEISCPDPHSGLYIQTRTGELVKVLLERDHLAFQVGEALQALSGGILQATPHCVVAADTSISGCPDVARCTFALFMQPHWDQCLDGPYLENQNTAEVEHWSPGITFGEFSKAKFKTYYK